MKLTFLGAAGEVTGSQHLIETDTHRFLLDCGLFQGQIAETYSKNATFHCSPKTLDGVFLSHAHIDHCGNLPGLYRAGYRGPIYCTGATAGLAAVMLRDSARVQEEDVKYIARHHERSAPPIEPLYSEKDAREVARLFEPLEEGVWHELSKDLSVRFQDAGHIAGSSIIELSLEDDRSRKRLVFSGDLGRRGMPNSHDPTVVDGCDVLICESTCGNRVHPPYPEESSIHADVEDLRWWIREMSMRGGIGECFLVHGEPEVARQLGEVIRDDCNEDPIVPMMGESFEV